MQKISAATGVAKLIVKYTFEEFMIELYYETKNIVKVDPYARRFRLPEASKTGSSAFNFLGDLKLPVTNRKVILILQADPNFVWSKLRRRPNYSSDTLKPV